MDPHVPYHTRPEYLEPRLLRHDDPGVARALVQRASQRLDDMLRNTSAPGFNSAKNASALSNSAPGLRDLYDAQVGYMDDQLRPLFAALRARGLLDNSIVVFTADHGEEIFEHGRYGHGGTLYEEVVRVPLLVWDSAGTRGRVDAPVSLVDVAPTVLDRVGLPVPSVFVGQQLPGMPRRAGGLRAWLRQRLGGDHDAPGRNTAFAELYPHEAYRVGAAANEAPLRAVVLPQWKLITDPPRGADRVFDLVADAGERKALQSIAAPPALRGALTGFVGATEAAAELAAPAPAPKRNLDETTRERLRALGYAP
jgi:arylsulfatase A-like enzyme